MRCSGLFTSCARWKYSLYGIITAQSFSVPYLLINEKIRKGTEYMSGWGVGKSFRMAFSLQDFGKVFLEIPLT
jgi:hypothetical protein